MSASGRETFYRPTFPLSTTPPITSAQYPPISPNTSSSLVILLPPYPPLGGSRHDPLLAAIAMKLRRPPYNAMCLAIDYPTKLSWTGQKEIDAVHVVVREGVRLLVEGREDKGLMMREEGGVEVVVVGYSYGGLVGSHVAALREVDGMKVRRWRWVFIAPPIGAVTSNALLLGKGVGKAMLEHVEGVDRRGLVLWGKTDEWTSSASFTKWMEGLGGGWKGVEVGEFGHVFGEVGCERVADEIAKWIDETDGETGRER